MARKWKGELDEHAEGQRHRNRVSHDKKTLLMGNMSKITVDWESERRIQVTTNQAVS